MIEDIERYCSDCPVQCHKTAKEFKARLDYDVISELAQRTLMGESGEKLDALIRQLAERHPTEKIDAEKFQDGLRGEAAQGLNEIGSKVESQQEERRSLAATCVGPLVTKVHTNGQSLDIVVCTSPEAYQHGNTHVPTHILRAFEG